LEEINAMQGTDAPIAEVVDLFCGVGALSFGLLRAGLSIKAGYDVDRNCKYAYETNNNAVFHTRDVAKLTAAEIRSHFSGGSPSVLAGCAPCQPFSTYKHRYETDPRWELVDAFARLAAEVKSDFVTMENVPALLKYKGGKVFCSFVETLEKAGYQHVRWSVVRCEDFGVPQKRRRLVLIASRVHPLPELRPTHEAPLSVRDAIQFLPPIEAGHSNHRDPLHCSASLSSRNIERIKASKPGGTWRDWPFELRADCHQRASGSTYPGVYARMAWDEPSPTMTTQCYGYGNGRFGHPEQDRAISLREAALLQTFPESYCFVPPGEKVSFTEVGRWIGNAVPVALAEAIGRLIVSCEPGGSLV
jgi:DNA (cytosine-5)-methyltransferase 1